MHRPTVCACDTICLTPYDTSHVSILSSVSEHSSVEHTDLYIGQWSSTIPALTRHFAVSTDASLI